MSTLQKYNPVIVGEADKKTTTLLQIYLEKDSLSSSTHKVDFCLKRNWFANVCPTFLAPAACEKHQKSQTSNTARTEFALAEKATWQTLCTPLHTHEFFFFRVQM